MENLTKEIMFCNKCGEAYQTKLPHECTTIATLCRDMVLYLKIQVPEVASKRELLGLIEVNNSRIQSTANDIKKAIDKIASGSADNITKEEIFEGQIELIAWCFYGIGKVGWDMNPHITWEVAWDKFKKTGQLPNSEWKNRKFREISNCNLLPELSSLRQQLKEREEVIKELLPIVENELHMSTCIGYSYTKLKAIIERARKTLNKEF